MTNHRIVSPLVKKSYDDVVGRDDTWWTPDDT